MERKVKFAIYTSFFNCSNYIDQIFENVLSIDYPDWMWFITDDFSTDGTGEILKEKIKGNGRIVYVDQSRKKEMYWQPNKFIPKEFEYVLLVCADDKVDPKILEVYDNVIRKNQRDISVLTCDLQEIYEENRDIKSIGYVLNQENIIKKLDRYYPTIDYVNNLGYFAFGLGMCFKNYHDLNFEIEDYDASSEDFYRILYMNSLGRWIHVPRNLYVWTARSGSESRKEADLNFYQNFEIAFNKCKNTVHEPSYRYNDCFKEFNSLMIEKNLSNYHRVSIISPWISDEQKIKLKEIYPDKDIRFNEYSGSDIYSVVANYFMEGDFLSNILDEIKTNNNKCRILIYSLDKNAYYSNDDISKGCVQMYDKIKDKVQRVFPSYNFFLYLRHANLIIDL